MHRLLLMVAIAGCGGETASGAIQATPRALSVSPPRLADGVVAMEPLCERGADERCEGVDGDCDARIDEGCDGAAHGAIEVAVAWNAGADVDLIVKGADRAASRADCADPPEPRLERAIIAAPSPGDYVIELQHANACGTAEEPLHASVSVSAMGSSLGTFNRALAPGERAPIVSFTLE